MNTQALKASSFRRVQARGLDFRVFDQGSGTPLLLLHGFPDDLLIWSAVIPPLQPADPGPPGRW